MPHERKQELVNVDRPWRGPCATTGHTMEDFAQHLGQRDQHGRPWDPRITRAAVAICRSYGIRGICDPGYVANVITNEITGAQPDTERLPDVAAETHQGYRNYETFSVAVVVDNDRELLDEARRVSTWAVDVSKYRFEAAEKLRVWVETRFTDWVTKSDRAHNIASTFVTAGLGAVAWDELLDEWTKAEGE